MQGSAYRAAQQHRGSISGTRAPAAAWGAAQNAALRCAAAARPKKPRAAAPSIVAQSVAAVDAANQGTSSSALALRPPVMINSCTGRVSGRPNRATLLAWMAPRAGPPP